MSDSGVLVAYHVYALLSIDRYVSLKTDTIWFLMEVSTTVHLSYNRSSSL